jgi:hypothetical protein
MCDPELIDLEDYCSVARDTDNLSYTCSIFSSSRIFGHKLRIGKSVVQCCLFRDQILADAIHPDTLNRSQTGIVNFSSYVAITVVENEAGTLQVDL